MRRPHPWAACTVWKPSSAPRRRAPGAPDGSVGPPIPEISSSWRGAPEAFLSRSSSDPLNDPAVFARLAAIERRRRSCACQFDCPGRNPAEIALRPSQPTSLHPEPCVLNRHGRHVVGDVCGVLPVVAQGVLLQTTEPRRRSTNRSSFPSVFRPPSPAATPERGSRRCHPTVATRMVSG